MRTCNLVLMFLAGPSSVGTGCLIGEPVRDGNPDAVRLERLVERLGDPKFATREAATRELIAIGEPALPSLRKAVAAPDAEIRSRAERAIEAIARSVTARELERLQGTWSLVSYETDGRRVKGEDKTHVFVFKEEEWSLQIAGQVFQAGTVQRIVVNGKLNAIDLLITGGGSLGATAISIYAVQGDLLKYLNCAEPRATEFTTKPGDGRHFLTFRRGKP